MKVDLHACHWSDPNKGPVATGSGFTRADLLALVGMILLLGALLVPAWANLGTRTLSVQCKSNLRMTGSAIEMYRAASSDSLPGPCWIGAFPNYQDGDSGRLASYIATYLGYPPADQIRREVQPLKCPASVSAKPERLETSPSHTHISYLLASSLTNGPGDRISFPFGRPADPLLIPAKHASIKRPSEEVAMIDVDREYLKLMGIFSATYINYLPALPVHNNRPGGPGEVVERNALYFDGAVRVAQSEK
jgi:hypothetical protein